MKTIIAGGRDIWNAQALLTAIARSGFQISEVLCGGATGVDEMGLRWALWNGTPATVFPADWKRFGPAAGPKRNALMAQGAAALVLLWDGKSAGSKNMLFAARNAGLKIYAALL